jgi:hypothetical protein
VWSIGIGAWLPTRPCHTTGHAGPHPAVRRVELIRDEQARQLGHFLSRQWAEECRHAGVLQALLGGNITIYTDLCEQTRAETYRLMCEHARIKGANAIVSMRYDATEIMAGLTEVLCNGTAVVVVPEGTASA